MNPVFYIYTKYFIVPIIKCVVPISSVFRLYYVVYIKFIFIFSVPDIAAYLFYNLVAVFAAENIFLAGI